MKSNYQAIGREKDALNIPRFFPSRRALEILLQGGMLSKEETPQNLIERVTATLFSIEHMFGTQPAESRKLAETFAEYIVAGYATLGTPALTNAGRYEEYALSSCAAIPIDLRVLDGVAKERILSHYRQNMGVGYDFSQYEDPVTPLTWINELAAREAATGKYDRYIGNMGLLSVSHPSIKDFIKAKREEEMRHFNISVSVTEAFMSRVEHEELFMLSDGTEIHASDLFYMMAENAWYNGDPGLIFLERMNRDNPLEGNSTYTYVTTPPCAEIGLAVGETCHFGYINLRRFIIEERSNTVRIDYDKLREVTELVTRALDNAIEYSFSRYPVALSASLSRMTRRMAIGVCGLADVFLAHKLPYDSQEARTLARDLLSFVTFTAKCASVRLADQRGPCPAMHLSEFNKYMCEHFLENKYARSPTNTVSSQSWERLANTIRTTRKLRNISITALAPTGRSSILLDSTPSVEPIFSIFTHDGCLHGSVMDFLSKELEDNPRLFEQVCQQASLLGSFQDIELLPLSTRACLKTAKEIAPSAHLRMIAEIAGTHGVIDEAASKTVNLPHNATVIDVMDVFLSAYRLGLKNISIYRDKTRRDQPEQL